MLFLALAASLVLQQTPPMAPAPVTPPPQTDAPTTAPVAAEARVASANQAAPAQVCRMEAVTGSRFGRRVCRSAVQTDEDRANSREMLRQMQGARTPAAG